MMIKKGQPDAEISSRLILSLLLINFFENANLFTLEMLFLSISIFFSLCPLFTIRSVYGGQRISVF